MAAKSATSRKWRAGVLHAGRAAAFLAIATGVNSVLTDLSPRYEPIYVYLIAVLVVAWLSSTILGVTAAVVAAILYDWMFAPVRVVPHVSLAIPMTVAVLVAVATRAARLPLRERVVLAEPVQTPPLLPAVERPAEVEHTPPVEVTVDDTHIRELEAQLAEVKQRLSDALHRADESERVHEQGRATAESRQMLLSKEIDALKQTVAEQSGRAALARREADAIAQRVAETDARIEAAEKKATDESERADREAKAREELEVAGHESLQKAVADLSARYEASLAEAKERTDAAAKKSEELQAQLADREKQGEATAAKMQALQRELDRTLATLSEEHARADRESKLRAQLEAAARQTLKTTAVVSSTHQKEATEAREAAQRAEERATELEQRSEALQKEIEELRGELTAARAEHDAARAALADELAAAKAALEEQEAGRIAAEAVRQKFTDESATLQKEIETLREDVDSERRRADHLHAAVEAADAQAEMARADAETAQKELADLEAGREKMTADFDAKLQKIVAGLAEDHENAIGDALLEREAAKAEVRRITQRMQELERTVDEARSRAEHERVAREKLDSEWSEKLQKIVTHLTEDHEADVGEAMLQREAARAEARTLTAKLAAAQKIIEEERAKFMRFTRRQTVVPTVEQPLPFPEAASSAPQVVLVVHSDAGVRAMTKHLLEQTGYTVATAADGLEALRCVAQQKPDVILAEAVMPKMNARELVQLLRSKRETSGVKIVLLTSRNEPARILDFTPDDVVHNPADFNELRTTLANVLARGVRT